MLAEVHETFWTLLRDPAHWEFEIFLMVVFDFIVGFLLYKQWLKPKIDRRIAAIRKEEHEIHGIEEHDHEAHEEMMHGPKNHRDKTGT